MKIKYLLLGLVLLSLPMRANERSVQEAESIAVQFAYSEKDAAQPRAMVSPIEVRLVQQRVSEQSKKPALYIFNYTDEKGYVIISADDRAETVLCYSNEGEFDPAQVNPTMQWWLDGYVREISCLSSADGYSFSDRTTVTTEPIQPILGKIAWGQEAPYNMYCPIDSLDTTQCKTGCVATAAAQIMGYWKYPNVGRGVHSYIWRNLRSSGYVDYTLTTDYSLVYFDWANISDTYLDASTDIAKSAVANLMLACARGCKMQFGGVRANGSAAWGDDMAYGLSTHLGYVYDKCVTMMSEEDYAKAKGVPAAVPMEYNVTMATLNDYCNQSLEASYPVMVGGDSNSGAHEFVLDGRDAEGRFHINWGWSGSDNCYCAISAMRPETWRTSFSRNLDAIIGLRPQTTTATNQEVLTKKENKYIINHTLYLWHDGHCFNAQGQLIR